MPVKPLSGRAITDYLEATRKMRDAFVGSPAETYVASRGISDKAAAALQLGYVPDGGIDGSWEKYSGRLAVPYLNMNKQVTGFKFRSLDPESDLKYLALDGWETTLYNIQALNTSRPYVCLSEGEADVWTWTTLGIPALGVPGVSNFKPHHKRILDGFQVLYWPDDDKAGLQFAKELKNDLPDVIICQVPGRCNDVNQALMAGYGDRLREMVTRFTEGTTS